MKRTRSILIAAALIAATAVSAFATGQQQGAGKVYNRYLPAKVRPFDPANMTDLYTGTLSGDVLEGLFQYKYLADNYELEPLIATGMPKVSADGLTYTFTLRKDAYFYDPTGTAFKDKKGRAVTSKDFANSLRRLADPAVKSGGWWLFDGYIAGLNEWRAAAKASGKADYAAPIEGVQTPDDQTLVVKLTQAYPQIMYCFAMTFTYPTPQEWLDAFGDEWSNYLIGTGAYYLDQDETIPGSQYILKKNPSWHGGKYPAAADIGPNAKKLGLEKDAGKALPFVDEVVYHIITESNPRWLKFMAGEVDYMSPPKENFASAIQNNKLTPDMVAKGITLDINPSLDLTYYFFNMEDPVWGAKNPNGAKLRKAVMLSYDTDKYIEIFDNGRAIPAQTVLPPGLGGYDPNYKNPYQSHNPEKAKQLIMEAGYKYVDGKAIGPDGKQLSLTYDASGTSTLDREVGEFRQKYFADVGIKMELVLQDWPTFTSKTDNRQAQFGGYGWGADYPDGQNFLQLVYGPNASPGPNVSNWDNPAFNALYEKAVVMQAGPERDKLYAQLAQMVVEDAPILVERHRLAYALVQPWVKNRFFRDIGAGYSKYVDIDLAMKAEKAGK